MYTCAECGKPVWMTVSGTLMRTCGHDTAAILAQAECKVKGNGGIKV